MIYREEDVAPKGGRAPLIPPAYPSGLPPATSLGIYLYYGIIDR
nr:MAG: hypothetical protein [Bacteriophage sp.]